MVQFASTYNNGRKILWNLDTTRLFLEYVLCVGQETYSRCWIGENWNRLVAYILFGECRAPYSVQISDRENNLRSRAVALHHILRIHINKYIFFNTLALRSRPSFCLFFLKLLHLSVYSMPRITFYPRTYL